MSIKNKNIIKGQDILLKFLKKTKEGQYAEVEKSSLKYLRVKEQAETRTDIEDYYSLS